MRHGEMLQNNRFKMDAFALYLLLQGLLWFLGSLTVGLSQLYRIREVGLSPLELVLVGTALEVSILLFEVPTGVLADVYSRRLSVIIGHVVVGLGMLLMGLVPTFWTMLLSSALWGLGYTFQSGAESAWLVDEVGQERAERAFLRSRQVGVIFGLVGMALTAYLANIALALPIIIGAVGYFILAILLIVVMPEKGFTPRPSEERATWQAHFDTLKEGLRAVRQRPPLRSLLVIGLIWGASSEGFDRLWDKYLLTVFNLPNVGIGDPAIFWFTAIDVTLMLSMLALTEVAQKAMNRASDRRVIWILFIVTSTLAIGLILFGFAPTLWVALVALFIIRLSREIANPIFNAWANRNIDSHVRATVLSIYGQADAIGEMGFGPGVGWVGNRSIRYAMWASAGLILPTLPLYVQATRYHDAVNDEATTPS